MVIVHVAKKNMVLFVIHRKKIKNFTDWRKIIYCRIIITSLIVKWDWYIRLQCQWHLNVDQHIKKEDSIYITYTGVYQVIKSINLYCYQCCVTFGNQSWLLLFSVTFYLLWLYFKGICPLFKMVIQNVLGGFFFSWFFFYKLTSPFFKIFIQYVLLFNFLLFFSSSANSYQLCSVQLL